MGNFCRIWLILQMSNIVSVLVSWKMVAISYPKIVYFEFEFYFGFYSPSVHLHGRVFVKLAYVCERFHWQPWLSLSVHSSVCLLEIVCNALNSHRSSSRPSAHCPSTGSVTAERSRAQLPETFACSFEQNARCATLRRCDCKQIQTVPFAANWVSVYSEASKIKDALEERTPTEKAQNLLTTSFSNRYWLSSSPLLHRINCVQWSFQANVFAEQWKVFNLSPCLVMFQNCVFWN